MKPGSGVNPRRAVDEPAAHARAAQLQPVERIHCSSVFNDG